MWSWFGTVSIWCNSVTLYQMIAYFICLAYWTGVWMLLSQPNYSRLMNSNRIKGWKTKIKENNNQWALLYIFSGAYNGQCQAEILFVHTIVPFGTPHLELTSENVSSKYWVVSSSLIISFILHPQLILLTNENPQLPVCIIYPLDW